MPDGWYKSLWKITSRVCFKMDITEDYEDLPLLWKKDVYLMKAFVDHSYNEEDLKQLNFVRKGKRAVSRTDITTVDGHRVTQQAFKPRSSKSLRNNIFWPRSSDVLRRSFINLWNLALGKCFFDPYSGIDRCLPVGLYLNRWISQKVAMKLIWWKSMSENQLYRKTNDGRNVYTQWIGDRYEYNHSTNNFPVLEVIPVSI